MLIGVTGLNGSGKDTIARYLVDNYNFVHRDLGQEIRDEIKKQGKDPLDRNEMILMGNEMRRKFGFSFWCKKAIESAQSKNIVITSLRNPSEVEEIKSRGGLIIEVFADQRKRYDRTVERVRKEKGAHGDVKSFEQFKEMEEKELKSTDPSKQQLLKCLEMASQRLDNNGTFNQLYDQVRMMVAKEAN